MSAVANSRRNVVTAVTLASVVAGMIGLSFAAVPLYRLFCEATGYLGTTQRASTGADRVLDHDIVVRFDGNVSGLPWNFQPEAPQVKVKLGETVLVNFVAENTSGRPTVGSATFNVTPSIAGIYFNKIECFCFTEQELRPGERIEMPVQFFVSPDYADDPELLGARALTLSYTFFAAPPDGTTAPEDNVTKGQGLKTASAESSRLP
jgi:cytochrome c oxidase assembly protein subunit 11